MVKIFPESSNPSLFLLTKNHIAAASPRTPTTISTGSHHVMNLASFAMLFLTTSIPNTPTKAAANATIILLNTISLMLCFFLAGFITAPFFFSLLTIIHSML